MTTKTMHFEKAVLNADEGESLGDLIRRVADAADDFSRRDRGQVTSVKIHADLKTPFAEVMYRLEDEVGG